MINALPGFPTEHLESYEVQLSRQHGEQSLGIIAATAVREFLWTFDENEGKWTHHPTAHSNFRSYDGDKLISVSMGLAIPDYLFAPPTTQTTMYHIHPTVSVSVPNKQIQTQMPSINDICAAAILYTYGYTDFRIATELGITSVSLSPAVATSGSLAFNTVDLSKEQLEDWTEAYGIVRAIKKTTDYYTAMFEGNLVIDFNAFTEASD